MEKYFICILKIDKVCSLSSIATNIVTEKLFIPAGQYRKWADMKNITSGNLFSEW